MESVCGFISKNGDGKLGVLNEDCSLLGFQRKSVVVVVSNVEFGQGLDETSDGSLFGGIFNDVNRAIKSNTQLLSFFLLSQHQEVCRSEPVGGDGAARTGTPETTCLAEKNQ